MKYLIWISLGLCVLWLINATGLIAAVAVFLLAGVIPIVGISIPPVLMLVLLACLLYGVLWWIKRQQITQQIRSLKAKHENSSKPLSSRRAASKTKQTRSTTGRRSRPARARHSQPKAATR